MLAPGSYELVKAHRAGHVGDAVAGRSLTVGPVRSDSLKKEKPRCTQSAGVQFPMEEARQGRTLYAAHPDFPTGRRIRVLAGMYRHARSRATGLHGTGAWPYEPVVLANGSCTNPRLG